MPIEQDTHPGIDIFAWLIIFSSLIHIHTLATNHEGYMSAYSYLPPFWIVMQYGFSWFHRLAGLLIAFGLIRRKELARKGVLCLAIFSILTIYWKHPDRTFLRIAENLQMCWGDLLYQYSLSDIRFTGMAGIVFIFQCLLDIIFQGMMLAYFTRSGVKKIFKQAATCPK